MKITGVETIQLDNFPNLLWLRLHTEDGQTGLGETFLGPESVSAYVHETAAHQILGLDSRDIEGIRHRLRDSYVGYSGSGVEMRGASAIDIALWDLLGKHSGLPVAVALGGRTRNEIALYNTCAGYGYVRQKYGQTGPSSWSINDDATGPYEDLDGFLNRPAELAASLLDEGISAMKIWPFDQAAVDSGGLDITAQQLAAGIAPFEAIRAAHGSDMKIMAELHSMWLPVAAQKIARALEPLDIYWIEDPIKMRSMDVLADFTSKVNLPVAASETMGTVEAFRDLINRRAADIIMLDLGFTGGLSEGRRIGNMAEAAQLPITAHDCTGPVVFAASVHLSMHLPNALIQEAVRAFYTGWYTEIVTRLPRIDRGMVSPPDGPGLGMELRPEVFKRADLRQRISNWEE